MAYRGVPSFSCVAALLIFYIAAQEGRKLKRFSSATLDIFYFSVNTDLTLASSFSSFLCSSFRANLFLRHEDSCLLTFHRLDKLRRSPRQTSENCNSSVTKPTACIIAANSQRKKVLVQAQVNISFVIQLSAAILSMKSWLKSETLSLWDRLADRIALKRRRLSSLLSDVSLCD